VAKNSEYHAYTITLGGKLTRNEPKVIQEDEEVDFTLDGLVLIDGDQIADTHSTMDHRFSHAESHQLHKVVVNGNAHSIFNGKIFVRKDAQKIDSFQENRNLLLSRDGLVNTKPQLEIFADDVLCSHGATIGQLDPEEVFYLQSRGMTEQKAKEVLTYAFALETIENIKVDSVHQLLIDEVYRYTKANNVAKVTA
jgi:Fe-S cluster assembly protein SufD